MTTHTLDQGTRSSSVLTLGTLASATYIASSSIDLGAALPVDVTFEVVADANGTPASNKRLLVFAKLSLDNSNFGSGPESGTTATEEGDLHLIGSLPMNDTNSHRKMFSIGHLPVARYMKIVCKNETGVALTSGEVYMASITGESA